jgi:hypothetical protein
VDVDVDVDGVGVGREVVEFPGLGVAEPRVFGDGVVPAQGVWRG